MIEIDNYIDIILRNRQLKTFNVFTSKNINYFHNFLFTGNVSSHVIERSGSGAILFTNNHTCDSLDKTER